MFTRMLVVALAVITIGGVAQGDVVTRAVQGDNNDAEEHVNAMSGDAPGTMESLTSSDLELLSENGAQNWQVVGVQFDQLGIPQGSTINSATVTFTVDNTGTTGDNNITIIAEATDNSAVFTSANANITSRNRTSATAPWVLDINVNDAGLVGTQVPTPDIASLVQEVVDRPGWADNNMLTVMFFPDVYLASPTTGGTTGVQEIEMESYPGGEPTLTVDFTPPVAEGEGEGEDITTGLVAHWKFEEPSGTTVADSSGNGHTLTLKTVGGADLPELNAPGQLGSAISFPPNPVGTAGYAEADNHPDFDITGSITLSAWVQIPDPWEAVGNNAHVFGKSDDTWQMRRESSSTQNSMKVSIRDRTGTENNDAEAQSTSQLVPGGEWTHLVGVYDESAGEVQFYFNGVLEDTAARTGPIGVNSHGVQVGANLSADGTQLRRNFGGLIDEVRVYSRALNAAEVMALFQDTGEGGEGEGEGEQGNTISSNVYPPFIDAGTTVVLTAPVGSDWQWRKDGADITGATDRTMVFDPVKVSDAGLYEVEYEDGTKVVTVSEPFTLEVLPEGSVPIAGWVGLAALLGALGAGGGRYLRRRK